MMKMLVTAAAKHLILSSEVNLSSRRVVIIGDVHGCADEAQELISRYTTSDDLIIFSGDMVNKGPKSCETISLAINRDCLAVKGNHDIASLKAIYFRQKLHIAPAKFDKQFRKDIKHSIPKAYMKGKDPDEKDLEKFAWSDGLSVEGIKYIMALPYIISIPYHNCMIVHAGLMPDIPLDSEDPVAMTNMRNIITDDKGHQVWEKRHKKGEAWAKVWSGPAHVYFGHDAKRGFQDEKFATGLDTGCVYGRKLTAVILNPDRSRTFVSVDSKEYVSTDPEDLGPVAETPQSKL